MRSSNGSGSIPLLSVLNRRFSARSLGKSTDADEPELPCDEKLAVVAGVQLVLMALASVVKAGMPEGDAASRAYKSS